MQLLTIISAEATVQDQPVHELYVDRYRALRDELRESFEVIRSRGQLRPGVTPLSAATSMLALIDGLNVQWLLEEKTVDMGAELQRFLALVLVDPSDPAEQEDDAGV